MYPAAIVELDPELPSAAEFWTPQPEDIDEENFGYFRDVWPIIGVLEDEAREMLYQDHRLSTFVAQWATTELEFDDIAKIIETGMARRTSDLNSGQLAALEPYLTEDKDDGEEEGNEKLDGLEVGVAGLVYALSAAGAYPAASCRGHPGKSAWSSLPVVLVAIDRCRAEVLAPLVRDAGCGFELDIARPELLVICGKSIENTLSLTKAIIDKLSEFRTCGNCDSSASPVAHSTVDQPSLFDQDM